MLMTTSAHPAAAETWPPGDYPVDSLRIEVTRQSVGATRTRHVVALLGSGRIEVRENTALQSSAPLARDALSALLDRLYRLRFFTLPDSYLTRYGVHITAEGRVQRSALRLPDRETTQVCVHIGAGQKCSVFADDGPAELNAFARDVRALAP